MTSLREYLSLHHKTHLIFDFDETIFMLLLPWRNALVYAANDLRNLDKNLYEKYENDIGRLSEMQNKFVKKHGKKAKDIFIENNMRFESEHLQGVDINQELIDFINTATNVSLFVWSSNTRPVIEKVLKEFGIHHKFEKIITRNDVDLLKPSSEGFTLIYDQSIPKSQYLMVGDSMSDEGAAKAAGIDFFRVMYF